MKDKVFNWLCNIIICVLVYILLVLLYLLAIPLTKIIALASIIFAMIAFTENKQ